MHLVAGASRRQYIAEASLDIREARPLGQGAAKCIRPRLQSKPHANYWSRCWAVVDAHT